MEHSFSKVELWSIWNKSCNRPIWAQINQTNFDSESFEYFKIRGDLEKVAIIKSVPNSISYIHKISRFFLVAYLFFSARKLISGLFIIKKPLCSGAHLSVSLSPGVTLPLAVVGGFLLSQFSRYKASPIPTARSEKPPRCRSPPGPKAVSASAHAPTACMTPRLRPSPPTPSRPSLTPRCTVLRWVADRELLAPAAALPVTLPSPPKCWSSAMRRRDWAPPRHERRCHTASSPADMRAAVAPPSPAKLARRWGSPLPPCLLPSPVKPPRLLPVCCSPSICSAVDPRRHAAGAARRSSMPREHRANAPVSWAACGSSVAGSRGRGPHALVMCKWAAWHCASGPQPGNRPDGL
jgi:hypothetical protein